jgi:hypothetical protein
MSNQYNPMFAAASVAPPAVPKIDRGDGKFAFIEDNHTRKMLINAFQAITITETWNFVAKDRYSFMHDTSPEIYKITEAMDRCEYPPGHSGASFAYTMRNMQCLAKYGIQEYKTKIQMSN